MGKTTVAAVSIFLLMLGGCGTTGEKTMEKKMEKEVSTGVGDCFKAGGTIEQPGGKPVCKMNDGSMKPIKLK